MTNRRHDRDRPTDLPQITYCNSHLKAVDSRLRHFSDDLVSHVDRCKNAVVRDEARNLIKMSAMNVEQAGTMAVTSVVRAGLQCTLVVSTVRAQQPSDVVHCRLRHDTLTHAEHDDEYHRHRCSVKARPIRPVHVSTLLRVSEISYAAVESQMYSVNCLPTNRRNFYQPLQQLHQQRSVSMY